MDESELYKIADELAKKSEDEKPSVDLFAMEPPTEETQEKAEQLLRQLMLARQRGQTTVVGKILEEALQLAPNYAPVQEAVGDDFVERRQFRKAKEAYLLAHKLDPANPLIENKYGEMVLKVDLRIDPATYSDAGTMASGRAAVVLNFLFPGVGHLVVGQRVTGAVLLALWLSGWLIALGTPRGMEGVAGMIGLTKTTAPFMPLVGVALAMIFGTWFYGISTIGAVARRMTPTKVPMPMPIDPSDLPDRRVAPQDRAPEEPKS